jgi:DNA-directed RNA polymerase specialized sigma24 family protein
MGSTIHTIALKGAIREMNNTVDYFHRWDRQDDKDTIQFDEEEDNGVSYDWDSPIIESQLLTQLPPLYHCIVTNKMLEYKTSEIAQEVGVSPTTVNLCYHKALNLMRGYV